MPSFSPSPSFERVLTAIRRQKEPDRLPFGEVSVDQEVKEAFLGKPIQTLQDDVDFWFQAGYDYVMLDTDLYATPQIQDHIVRPHENTAVQYNQHRRDRNWVASKAEVITSWEDVDAFSWPTAADLDYEVYHQLPALLPDGMKAIVTFGHIYTIAQQLMGFETFCIKLVEDKPLVKEIIKRLGEETMRYLEMILQFDCVGATCIQDDIAYTSGLMISPKLLREIFYPWLKRAADLCHAYNKPIIYHSDGDMTLAIPDVIEAGIDALHPIEPKCMDIVAVKRQYGDRIALVGNVDLGYTLTLGTPEEVREDVKRLIQQVGPGGGYLMSSANSITNYVPLENYLAMLDTVRLYGQYPLRF